MTFRALAVAILFLTFARPALAQTVASASPPKKQQKKNRVDDFDEMNARIRALLDTAKQKKLAPLQPLTPVAEPVSLALNDRKPANEMDFDLLGSSSGGAQLSAAPPGFDASAEQSMGMRRAFLTVHQTLGIGLVGLMGATMVTGQLNYNDHFGGAESDRFKQPHEILATVTLATFAGAGLLAFFAPVPLNRESEGLDRATIHKAGMIGATAGMVAEGILGIATASSEGAANQATVGRAHLAIGYFTLACMTVGLGALVF